MAKAKGDILNLSDDLDEIEVPKVAAPSIPTQAPPPSVGGVHRLGVNVDTAKYKQVSLFCAQHGLNRQAFLTEAIELMLKSRK